MREKWNSEEMKEKWKARKAKMYKELGLTDEQKKKFEAHRKSHWENNKKIRETIKAKRKLIRDELEKESINEARVRQLHNEIKALNAQKADARLNGILEARKNLTADQFKKFNQLKKKHKDEFGHRKKKGSWGHHE